MCPATCAGQCGGLNTATTATPATTATTVTPATTATTATTTPTTTATTTTDTTTSTTTTITTTTDTTTSTTTTDTTTTVCADPGCMYGFIWRFDLCTCNCNIDAASAFTGSVCQNVDCTKAVDTDPVFCSIITCTDPTELQSCPVTCGVCPASG